VDADATTNERWDECKDQEMHYLLSTVRLPRPAHVESNLPIARRAWTSADDFATPSVIIRVVCRPRCRPDLATPAKLTV